MKDKIHEGYDHMDTNDRIIINLRDAGKRIKALYEGKSSQNRILIILNEAGDITQRRLTERLGIKPGSASEVLLKLERAGLIVRTPNEADHRTTDISLTKEGQRRGREAAERRKERHKEMFSCLSDAERETFLSLLEKVNSDWSRRYVCDRGKHKNRERTGA